MTGNPTPQQWPELPERINDWPGAAFAFGIADYRTRRGKPSEDGRIAAESVGCTRNWWRVSNAHQWPTGGKLAQRLEAGIEPALLELRRMGARLRHDGNGASIMAPAAVSPDDLAGALVALGLQSLPVVAEAGERAA